MSKSWQLHRRTFLRGLGTALALPLLESMVPVNSVLGATGGDSAARRMAFIYIPNGANMADWTPATTGPNYELPMILQPLKDYKSDFQVISGLAHVKARANGDGGGDHARANATFLTGCQARKTAGADIRAGISVDQVAAAQIGLQTKLASLELSTDKVRLAGACDSGYSCVYQHNISWKSASTPMPPEVDPRVVFDRMFSSGKAIEVKEVRSRREMYQKSILDFVMDDAKTLRGKLGQTDQQKLDEYMTSVRELEVRIEQAEKFSTVTIPKNARPRAFGKDLDYQTHLRLMYDIMVLAFQTDSTRISTFMVAHDGSNRPYPFIGVSEGHHDLSHHQNDALKKSKIAKINRFHVEQFAYFLKKMKSVKEGDGTLLDNSMIVYGGAIADGNAHAHHDLPVLLAGKGGGTVKTGEHVRFPKETPMTNLFLSMLDRMNVKSDRLGDSTKHLQIS